MFFRLEIRGATGAHFRTFGFFDGSGLRSDEIFVRLRDGLQTFEVSVDHSLRRLFVPDTFCSPFQQIRGFFLMFPLFDYFLTAIIIILKVVDNFFLLFFLLIFLPRFASPMRRFLLPFRPTLRCHFFHNDNPFLPLCML